MAENKLKDNICNNQIKEIKEQNWTTTAEDLLLDIKVLLKEYYIATFTDSENALTINFKNGQTFILSVTRAE